MRNPPRTTTGDHEATDYTPVCLAPERKIRARAAARQKTAGLLEFTREECDYSGDTGFSACRARRIDRGKFLNFKVIAKASFIVAASLWLLTGCSVVKKTGALLEKTDALSRSDVEAGNPYVVANGGAMVYFIRARPEKPMGAADNIITVDINDTELLQIDKGEYLLVFLKETEGARITVHNDTAFGPFNKLMKKSKTRSFNFAAGRTYLVNLEMVDGEFRGVHFVPTAIDLDRAKTLTRRMRAVGDAAQSRPIDSL